MKKVIHVVRKTRAAAFTAFVALMITATLLVMSYGTPPTSANCLFCQACSENGGHVCGFGSTEYCVSCGSSSGCYGMECSETECHEIDVDQGVLETTCSSGCGVSCN